MKTTGMFHQVDALRRMNGRDSFALFMSMGTGKSWTVLADAERMYAAGRIDGLLVIAPKGVHVNWVTREIPTHLECKHIAAVFQSGASSRKYKASIERLFQPRYEGELPPLRILSMNIDAVGTKAGLDLAKRFLNVTKAMMVVDESTRIKNPSAQRTKRIMALGELAVMRRILSGLPVTNSPPDLFSQMEFLESGLLGTTSYRAFVAEYAHLLPPDHGLMRHVMDRMKRQYPGQPLPQLVERDENGNPKYRNLDKLARLIEPHSYRVRKDECLDLPPKVFTVRPFQLDPSQRRIYEQMEDELRMEFEDSEPQAFQALAALSKLRQITSGFVLRDGEMVLLPIESNPRFKLLEDILEELDGQFIIWAHYRAEIDQIGRLLDKNGISHAQYHGGVNDADREKAVDGFQSGKIRCFLGQPQSGGIGLTLTAASTVIYFSNDFNLETRLQSEDRAHRIGTKHSVTYIDLIAEGTRDETIASALQRKAATAAEVMGDPIVACALGFQGEENSLFKVDHAR